MADLSITASAVLAASTATIEHGTAGEAATAGQTIYLDETAGTYKLADADGSGTTRTRGIALHAASTGQPLAIIKEGLLTMNAVLTAGVTYFQSPVAGGIGARAEVLTGDYVTSLGTAISTTVLRVKIDYSGVVSA
jgi:hypothetical protein